jgi:GGDEF domain-containing protein
MPPVTPRRRRARPVADAPIDVLLGRSEDLAKGWLLALLEQSPLGDAPSILSVDLIRDGPRVCDAVLRAIADDTDLHRLEPDGALTPLIAGLGELAGAGAPVAVSRAVDALQAVIWTALRDELRGPDPELVSGLAERLTVIGELLRSAALAGLELRHAGDSPPARDLLAVPDPAPTARPDDPAGRGSVRGLPAAESRDALWVGALEDEIRRAISSGAPLSLLLAELQDADGAPAVESPAGGQATFGRFARALRAAVRRQEILACETDTRAWIIAPDTPRGGAAALGARIAGALREADLWRGAPLVATVGVAVLGEDGRTGAELMQAAEEARLAASAAGVDVATAGNDH